MNNREAEAEQRGLPGVQTNRPSSLETKLSSHQGGKYETLVGEL